MHVIPSSKYSRSALAVILLQAVTIITIESSIGRILLRDPAIFTDPSITGERGVPVYLIIFILGHLYLIYLCWDAIYNRNTIQIIACTLFDICVLGYTIFQYVQVFKLVNLVSAQEIDYLTDDDVRVLDICLLAIPAVMGGFLVVICFLSWKLYKEYGWKIYKKIGGDLHMRDMYRNYQIYLVLIKLDVFFVFGFQIEFLILIISTSDYEFVTTIVAVPFLILMLVLGIQGVRRENKAMVYAFMICLCLGTAYFIFKVVRIYTQPDIYQGVQYFLAFFALIALAVVLMTLVNAWVCLANFGNGLRQHLLIYGGSVAELAVAPMRMPLE